MKFFLKKIPLSLISLITLCLIALSTQAQDQPSVPTSVIPYQGTLFSQGKPVSQSAPVQMAFALYSNTTGLDAGQTDTAPAANRVWSSWGAGDIIGSDQTIPIQVRNGRFLVHLGEDGQAVLADSVFDQRPLSVVTWVVNEAVIFRLPPNTLKTVPHAITASRALTFEVRDHLVVKGTATIDGTTQIKGELTLGDSESDLPSTPHPSELIVTNAHNDDYIRQAYYVNNTGFHTNYLSNGSFHFWTNARNTSNDDDWRLVLAYDYPSNKTIFSPQLRKVDGTLVAIGLGQLGREIVAECAANEIVISGGCFLSGGVPNTVLHDDYTDISRNRHTCIFSNYNSNPPPNVRAHATCLRICAGNADSCD